MKIIGTAWHTTHQAEIAKMSFIEKYDLLVTNREWAETHRPFPDKCSYVPYIENNYDLAILHIDQQVVEPRISKGRVFYDLFQAVRQKNIPTVIINHMTPFSDRLSEEKVVEKVKRLLGDTPMITNSKTAAKQWGWGYPIIHGLEVDEWWDLPKEPRILTVLSGGGMEKAYKRRLLTDTMQILNDEYGHKLVWIGGDAPARKSFDDYRDYLGRSLIFFMPTRNSPMPRARTEAMLSGCCIVSTRHQDWEDYITEGENGFLVKDNPEYCARLLDELIRDYPKALKVGKKGREFARKTFTQKSFEKQWVEFLKKEGLWK